MKNTLDLKPEVYLLNAVKNGTNVGPQYPLVVALSVYSFILFRHSQARLTQRTLLTTSRC